MPTVNVLVNGSTTLEADELKSVLAQNLRSSDEAILLPGAAQSKESMAIKNTVICLDGDASNVPVSVFNCDWYHGISAVQVPSIKTERILQACGREELLARLKDAIPNELCDQVEIGPSLESEDSRDLFSWECGMDSSSCCIGLYSCDQELQTEGLPFGTQRAHRKYYLVCKAGSGRAGQEMHERVKQAAKDGMSLNKIFEPGGSPGEEGLRRVQNAGRRNRARMLWKAAVALEFEEDVDSVMDNASSITDNTRHAILTFDVHTNALVPLKTGTNISWVYHAGAVDTTSAQGLLTASNVAAGFVLVSTANQSTRLRVSNNAYSAIPFGSVRITSNLNALRISASKVHEDSEWIKRRFSWKVPTVKTVKGMSNVGKETLKAVADIEPAALWGTHAPESWVQQNGKELGISSYTTTRLRPEIVVLAGTEPAALRNIIKQRC